MKTVIKLFVYICVLLLSAATMAQEAGVKPQGSSPIPVELFFGNNRVATQVTVSRKFRESSRFGVFASTLTAGDYKNILNEKNQIDKQQNDSESMNSLYLTYDVYKGLGLISGAGLNSSWGFRPFAGAQYGYRNKAFSINMSSGFYLTQSKNSETKVAVQFRPHLKGNWSLFTGVQALYNQNMNTNKHDRSAVYGRLGVNCKSIGFGLATNLDWYGPLEVLKENYGLFISYAFK